ncbi:Omp28-related outer membrane protein [bacterium]|nr:Omp28-related outer membrane protein [bacterium]
MNKKFSTILLLISGLIVNAFAFPRIVLFEQFSNTSCAPCASAQPSINSVIGDYAYDDMVHLEYHVYWPSSTDPFYSANTSENINRISYYGVDSAPTVIEDGYYAPNAGNISEMVNGLFARFGKDSPLRLEAYKHIAGTTCSIFVSIYVDRPVASDTRLRIAVTESNINYSAPNGLTHFDDIMRDLVPSGSGILLDLSAAPDTQYFNRVITLNPGWSAGNLNVVAWVQDDDTREVVQCVSDHAVPLVNHRYFSLQTMTCNIGLIKLVKAYIQNMGSASDDYQIDITGHSVPSGWVFSYITGAGEFTGTSTLTIPGHTSDSIQIKFNTHGIAGTGYISVTVASSTMPSHSNEITYYLLNNPEILVVSDDGDDDYDHYFTDALDALGAEYQLWNTAMASPTGEDLSAAPIVIWFAGWSFPTLTAFDRQALITFLDSGGKLFITGQDIGWDLCDANGTAYGTGSCDFLNSYLYADFVDDDTDDHTLSGVPGDPITDGLNITISGGDGADNQLYPSEIDPWGIATPIFNYSAGICGGIRANNGISKVVYLAFGYEAIDSPGSRSTLMQRILEWFGYTLAVEELVNQKPSNIELLQVFPNPFNSRTTVSAKPPEGEYRLLVYDLLGNQIKSLGEGRASGNELIKVVWDGENINANFVASGLYFIVLHFGENRIIKKTMLLK